MLTATQNEPLNKQWHRVTVDYEFILKMHQWTGRGHNQAPSVKSPFTGCRKKTATKPKCSITNTW